MIPKRLDNLNNPKRADSENCSVCRDLLTHLDRFFDMLETGRRSQESDWLTVEDVAAELKVSKSIVYKLIHQGELEAVNISVSDNDKKKVKKGHYRIKRTSLNQYLESKRVKPFPNRSIHTTCSRRPPKVKNYLRL